MRMLFEHVPPSKETRLPTFHHLNRRLLGRLAILATLVTAATVQLLVPSPARASAPRYLNIHECRYYVPALADHFVTIRPTSIGGTNVSNSADTSVTCRSNLDFPPGAPTEGFPAGYIYLWGASQVRPLDLTAGRYLNLHQCVIYNNNDPDMLTSLMPTASTGTNVSNVPAGAPSCVVPAAPGWGYLPQNSGVAALDLTAGRYLNLHQCVYRNSGNQDFHTTFLPTSSGGTNVRDTPDTAVACAPAPSGWSYVAAFSGVMVFDLRG
ncbi:hypothetical protein [Actinoplanes sp. NPDC049265]|uniref:hypothetical protein n=1 Tax=Actinoplanes sp. NPDC049265 TaxID=3363902 RepID=UPI003712D8AD